MGQTYTTITKKENLHFDNEQEIHMSSKNYEENDYGPCEFANHLAVIACLISYKKRVQM